MTRPATAGRVVAPARGAARGSNGAVEPSRDALARPATPWAAHDEGGKSRKEQDIVADARTEVLLEVEDVRSHVASWQRALQAATKQAGQPHVSPDVVQSKLGVDWRPRQAAEQFAVRDAAAAVVPRMSALRSLVHTWVTWWRTCSKPTVAGASRRRSFRKGVSPRSWPRRRRPQRH
jgi:hypothetical protein